jgi:hypothetical protein
VITFYINEKRRKEYRRRKYKGKIWFVCVSGRRVDALGTTAAPWDMKRDKKRF